MKAGAWRNTLGFGALLLIARATGAVSLGPLEVRSHAGAPLEARIPVLAAKGEPLRGACFSLAPRGAVPLREASLELRRSARGTSLFVRTRAAVGESAAFAIAIACPDAAARAVPVEFAVRLSPSATRGLPVVTSLAAREGDTLASLGHAIFPTDDSVRARYLQAIRGENEALAKLGDDEPLPAGANVALPDLHAFAETIAPARASRRRHVAAPPPAPLVATQAPGSHAAPKAAVARAAAPASASRTVPRTATAASRAQTHPPATQARADGFRLRLSAPVMDLSPSKGMDERKRAELRERLLALEADDRTAAMLAMQENIRRLEAQVDALKLRLAAMPSPLPAAKKQAATIESPKLEARKLEAPKSAAPTVEDPKAAAPGVETSKVAAANLHATAVAAAESAKAATEAAKAKTQEARKPNVIPRAPGEEAWYSDALWWLRVLLVPLAGLLGLRYFARRRAGEPDVSGEPPPQESVPDVATTEPGAQGAGVAGPPPAEMPAAEPAGAAATRVAAEDNADLRRRYMEERFPEIVNGAVVLADPRSVVKSARLLYEDGAVARAIELLQFAIEQDADAMQPWLALFAIFRLQGLAGEFAELARRFAGRHGASDQWRDVRAIGRALDPANPLYEGVESGAPVDPEARGWLRAPGGDARRALAAELRSRLMAAASVSEGDLRPDPTPALRKTEVVSVA